MGWGVLGRWGQARRASRFNLESAVLPARVCARCCRAFDAMYVEPGTEAMNVEPGA